MDYASWQRRAGGLLVDVLVGILPVVIGGSLVLASRDAQGYIHNTAPLVLYLMSQLIAVAVTVHNRWVRGGRTGRTWGRVAFGTRLVERSSGEPVGIWTAFLRDCAHLVGVAPLLLGFLLPLRDGRRQTFADKLVDSVVVRYLRPADPDDWDPDDWDPDDWDPDGRDPAPGLSA